MKKPYIKIVYPDASEIAMLLTEAMVRRASGKRVVETESAEREHTGQDLFAGSLCCVTETSVELTLNLAPEAMDFALATLIAKNLTQTERDKAMSASDSLELDALFAPRAEAGASTCTEEVRSAPLADDEAATQGGEAEAKIEIGKMEAVDLRRIITDLQDDMVNHRGDHIEIAHRAFDAICEAAHMTKHDFAVETSEDEEESNTWLTAMLATLIHLAINSKASKKNRARDIAFDFLNREEIGIPDRAWTTCVAIDKALEEAYKIAGAINKADPGQVDADDLFERLLHEMDPDEYPMEESVQLDKADRANRADRADEAEAEQDGEIEPGLLNDIDEDKSSTAEVGTRSEPTEETAEATK